MSERIKWDDLTEEKRDEIIHQKVFGWQPKSCLGPQLGKIVRESEPLNRVDPPQGLWHCALCQYLGCGDDSSFPHNEREDIPEYSTNMNDAWKIVEKMTSRMGYQDITFEWHGPLFKPEHNYLTQEGYPLGTTCWYVIIVHDGLREFICADTPQEAICKAALKAMRIELD